MKDTDEMDIKNKLCAIQQMKYAPSETEKEQLVFDMLDNIGSTDSELRDDLIYSTFSQWMQNGDLPDKTLKSIYELLFTERHIFHGIGETGTDSVFKRSFSVLLIPLLLIANQNTPFLRKEDIAKMKEDVIRYIHEEKDVRGYVAGKGWAHAMAHIADAIDELGKNAALTDADKFELLEAVRFIICKKSASYSNLEDERLTTAVVTILRNAQIASYQFENWLREFTRWDKTEKWNEEYIIITNVKNFLSSLYFRLSSHGDQCNKAPFVKDVLQKMMQNYI